MPFRVKQDRFSLPPKFLLIRRPRVDPRIEIAAAVQDPTQGYISCQKIDGGSIVDELVRVLTPAEGVRCNPTHGSE